MGDLISRSALIEELNKMGRDKFTLDDWYEHWLNGMICALERIERQPTAYDVDKVVAELESKLATMREKQTIACTRSDGYWTPLQSRYGGRIEELIETIDIVKRGGRDE